MNINSLGAVASSYFNGLQKAGSKNDAGSVDSTLSGVQSDGGRISPFAKLLSTLQTLPQSDPAKYKEVTADIATKLKDAASKAQESGDTKTADRLNKLAQDFTDASKSGELPNIKDLATAVGHHHGHHHLPHPPPPDGAGEATPDTTSTAGTSMDTLQQLLTALQANTTQDTSVDPISIITGTLSSAGIDS